MLSSSDQIKYLEDFRDRNKFSVSAWGDRGLGPSDSHISESLHVGFRDTAQLLISAVTENASKGKIKSILISSLRHCQRLELDTEEKEYAAELFHELSSIVGVDIRHRLNVFLYGYFLIGLIYFLQLIKPKRKFKTIQEKCENCNSFFTFELDLKTLKPDSNWTICQCAMCRNYFLMSHQESANRIKYQNCMPVEYLSKEEYSLEQAENRLEQIRYFRK